MSKDYIIRPVAGRDFPELSALWARCFGDGDDYIGAFFALLPKLGAGAAAERGGKAVGMAYAIIMELAEGAKSRKLGYIYAVAVNESCRGLGMGAALSKAAADAARELGAESICTLPAEDSLYPWYEKLIGTRYLLRRRQDRLPAAFGAEGVKISAHEYNTRREALLAAVPHLRISEGCAELLQALCECNGGALIRLPEGLAAAYLEGDVCIIRELICPDKQRNYYASAAAYMLGAKSAQYFTPDKEGEKYIALDREIPADTLWNIAFD